MLPRLAILGFLLVPWLALAQGITPDELARAPSPARISFLADRAAEKGWGGAVPLLRAAALQAYETNSGYASAWYYLYRWAALLGQPESTALGQWVKQVERARVGHANMERKVTAQPGDLVRYWSRDLQLFALGSPSFSEEFFTTIAPVDNPVMVLSLLQTLYGTGPARFADYQNLAIAIAVVYDVPPPPGWPHGQVSAQALPRQMPKPDEAFDYWVKADRENRTAQRLRRLGAEELKFVVDTGALFTELNWAQQNIRQPLADFAKVYDLVRYRKDRQEANQFMWPKPTYLLPVILAEGGICVDQAYFACMAGKARGIPTLLFRGAGLDGRHAWFGYLDGTQNWQLDGGRYADQKFVVGLAYDPQTWGNINDYELLFMSERFRALPSYRLSMMHAEFASEYERDGKHALALKAAREAVNREHRNLAAWNMLLQAQEALTTDPRVMEGALHEAAVSFQKYPDLERAFALQLVQSLRARGETSAADFEEQRLARKYQTGRVDLSIQQAADIMERSMKQDDAAAQMRNYQQALDSYGRGAGMDFYDKVVRPFAVHLQAAGQLPAAIQSVERARQYLRLEKGGQLEAEISALLAKLKTGQK